MTKENFILEALKDKETIDNVYLGDAVLHKNFDVMIKANNAAILDIDAVITEIGENLTVGEVNNDFWIMLFKYLFEIRKNLASILSESGEAIGRLSAASKIISAYGNKANGH